MTALDVHNSDCSKFSKAATKKAIQKSRVQFQYNLMFGNFKCQFIFKFVLKYLLHKGKILDKFIFDG